MDHTGRPQSSPSGVTCAPPSAPTCGVLVPRALITGITGQDGLYLSELLLAKGYEVHGIIRGQNNPKRELVQAIVPEVLLHTGDLTDLSSLMRALSVSEPDEFYN